MDGLVGSFGRRGEKGMVGEPGANAKFCPCPIELQLINAHNQFSEVSSHKSAAKNILFLNFYEIYFCFKFHRFSTIKQSHSVCNAHTVFAVKFSCEQIL